MIDLVGATVGQTHGKNSVDKSQDDTPEYTENGHYPTQPWVHDDLVPEWVADGHIPVYRHDGKEPGLGDA